MKRFDRRPITAVAASLLALAAGCGAPEPTPPDTAGAWQVVARPQPPAAPGSMGSSLHVGGDGRVYLSWIETRRDGGESPSIALLRFAVLDGDGWSDARTIASGDDWFVNWADFPSMAALADGTLATHWLRKSGEATYAYDVVVARSLDGGVSWSEPAVLHDDGTQTEHGFVSIVPADDRSFHVVWLDGRRTGGSHGGGHDGHGGGGAMTLRSARLERDGTVRDRVELDDRVCDCCQTDAVIAGDGSLVAAYRDRDADEVRDISLVRVGSGQPPVSLHDDGWLIPACPVNGPALAASGETTVAAWFTAADDDPRVLVAFAGGGSEFGAPYRLSEGPTVGRVDIAALDNGTAFTVWNAGGALRLQRVGPGGPLGEPLSLAATSDARAGGFPRLARIGDTLVASWTEPGEPSSVRTAIVRRSDADRP